MVIARLPLYCGWKAGPCIRSAQVTKFKIL